ncbi:peroxiredoxin [Reyranella sp.]|uniref:peroxiredoxin family protein n=1 Tax=Reyranella sp. TaxID=1929291 RepID=UPI00121EF9EA|nr:redoxin domain-containing protein [Reyranella sp.]TAJ86175.1 MAG: redoxin domain-containing protein [Reyranella sp.]
MTETLVSAPPIEAERWFNTDLPLSLEMFHGKVVVLHAFQMLCPGCVSQAVPQARRLHEIAKNIDDLVVLGIHTVFEHHAAMTPVSLEAFLHEYRLTFPVAVDRASSDGPIPQTMAAYGFKGTPSTVVIDREGRIARHSFGAEDDLVLGLMLGSLLSARP